MFFSETFLPLESLGSSRKPAEMVDIMNFLAWRDVSKSSLGEDIVWRRVNALSLHLFITSATAAVTRPSLLERLPDPLRNKLRHTIRTYNEHRPI